MVIGCLEFRNRRLAIDRCTILNNGFFTGFLSDPNEIDNCVHKVEAKIEKVHFNGPCTIVMWDDKTKTIVRRSPGDKNDRRVALIYAIAKKKFGSNSQIQKEIGKFAKSNAQRVAILSYIVAKDGFDVDAIYEEFMNED